VLTTTRDSRSLTVESKTIKPYVREKISGPTGYPKPLVSIVLDIRIT